MRPRVATVWILALAAVLALGPTAPASAQDKKAAAADEARDVGRDVDTTGRAFRKAVPKYTSGPAGRAIKTVLAAKRKLARLDDEGKARRAKVEALAEQKVDAVLAPLRAKLLAGDTEPVVDKLWYLVRGRGLDAKPKAEGEGEQETSDKKDKDPDSPAAIEKAAEKRFRERVKVDAMVMNGDLHMVGQGVIKNYSLARQWYLQAAKEGDPDAAFKLARQFEQALGVPRDLRKAVEWHEVAAEGGNGPAMVRLAEMLAHGEGVDPKPAVARIWLDQAVAAGEAVPADLVAEVYKSVPEKGDLPPSEDMADAPNLEDAMAAVGQGMEQGFRKMAEAMAEGMVESLGAGLTGGTPAPLKPVVPPPGVQNLVDRYVAAVRAKDLEAMSALFDPRSTACVTPENKAFYDKSFARAFDDPPADRDGYPIKLAEIGAQGAVPYGAFFDYAQRPTHHLEVDLETDGGGTAPLVAGVIKAGDEWFLAFPCVDPSYLAGEKGDGGRPASKGFAAEDADAYAAHLVSLLKAGDPQGLRAALHPKAMACVDAKTRPWFDFVDQSLLAIDFSGETRVEARAVGPDDELKGHHRIRPTHQVEITYAIRKTKDGSSSQSLTEDVVLDGGLWYRDTQCPTSEELAMLPMMRALLRGMEGLAEGMGQAMKRSMRDAMGGAAVDGAGDGAKPEK